jgi:hypothetical protein
MKKPLFTKMTNDGRRMPNQNLGICCLRSKVSIHTDPEISAAIIETQNIIGSSALL